MMMIIWNVSKRLLWTIVHVLYSITDLIIYQNSIHHRHFHCSLQARLLQHSLSQPRVSTNSIQQPGNTHSSSKGKESEMCISCLQLFLNDDKHVECSICAQKLHLNCSGVVTWPVSHREAQGRGATGRRPITGERQRARRGLMLRRACKVESVYDYDDGTEWVMTSMVIMSY